MAYTDLGTGYTWGNYANTYGHNASHNFNARFATSYVTGSHAIKAGFTFMHLWAWTSSDVVNNGMTLQLRNGVPTQVTVFATPFSFYELLNANYGLFVQDQWTHKRMTVNAGVRFDALENIVPAQTIGPGPQVPTRNLVFDEVRGVPKWRDVTPAARRGLRSVRQRPDRRQGLDRQVPRGAQSADVHAARQPGRRAGPERDANLGGSQQRLRPAGGRARRDHADQLRHDQRQHALRPGGADASRLQLGTGGAGAAPAGAARGRRRRLLPALVRQHARDRQPVGDAGRLQPVLRRRRRPTRACPDGGGYQVCGLYDVNRLVPQNNVISLASKFGNAKELYNGFDLTVNARLPNGIVLSGGPSIGRTESDYCFAVDSPQGTGLPPNQGATSAAGLLYCHVTPPFQANVKMLGVYPLPWGDVQLAATFQSLPGPQILASRSYTNAEIAPSLGRNLATGVNGVASVQLIEPGTMYDERLYQLDLRASKLFRFGRSRLQANVDLYNAANAGAILSINTTYGSNWMRPTNVLQGRLLRLGGQLDF